MRITHILFFCTFIISCGKEHGKTNTRYLPESNGNLNTLSVVIDNALWEGKVGEEIRHTFATPLNGLPVDEPLYKMRQIPPTVFDGFTTRSRIILKIEKGVANPTTKIKNQVFAKPQTLAFIGGKTDQIIIDQIKKNSATILDAYNTEEVKEKQRRINLSLLKDKTMEKALGFTINIPSAYRISKAIDNFFWIRKNLSNSKTIELMFYEIPIEKITQGNNPIVNIVKVRDSITKSKIPGEDGIFMAVEDSYAPSLFEISIDKKPTLEVRGLWEMKGYTMAGPFVTYLIEDKTNSRYLVADGYVYAPSLNKRNYVFEIESIIKSIKIK